MTSADVHAPAIGEDFLEVLPGFLLPLYTGRVQYRDAYRPRSWWHVSVIEGARPVAA